MQTRSITFRSFISAVFCVVPALLLASCSAPSSLESNTSDAGFSGTGSQQRPASAINTTSSSSGRAVEALFEQYSIPGGDGETADYRLAPMDVVEVTVFGAPELTRTAQVSASGYITLPLVGDVKASGRTMDQLQADIESKLKRNYMQAPEVFVTVKEYNSQRVTVDGAVNKPGVFPLTGKTTLIQALSLAGGLNDMASPKNIFVLRTVKGKRMAARFDLTEIRTGAKPDPVIIAGDIVIVDESGAKQVLEAASKAMQFTGIFSMLFL